MNRALPFFLIKTIIIVNKGQKLSALFPQYTLEANRSRGSWVILGHPNKQTDKQTSRDYYFIYIDVNLAKVLFASCSVLSPSQIPPRTWSRWRLFSSLYSFLVEMGAFTFFFNSFVTRSITTFFVFVVQKKKIILLVSQNHRLFSIYFVCFRKIVRSIKLSGL